MKSLKRIAVFVLSLAAILASFALAGCADNPEPATYGIWFHADGGMVNGKEIAEYPETRVKIGESIELPEPTKFGYNFLGWFTNDGEQVTSPYCPPHNIDLSAKWDGNGEDFYEFIESSSQIMITGLTDKGRKQTIIGIPEKIGGVAVTYIGDSAFKECGELILVTIPDSVTSIGMSAFESCGLEDVTIGTGIKSIGSNAFYNCTNLKRVTVKATSPPSLGLITFTTNAEDRHFYVPHQSESAYKTDNSMFGWSQFKEYIYGASI